MKQMILMVIGLCMVELSFADVVCATCKDTGKIKVKCDVCRGTRYVWTCTYRDGSSGRRTIGRYDEDGYWVYSEDETDFCGYGSVYKPLHKNCKNTRKRMVCPKCGNTTKTSATGTLEVECPDCDGEGHLMKKYYIIRDVNNMSISSYDINMMLRMLKNGRADWGNSIFVRRMSEEDVLDFKAINPNCEFFTEEEKFVNFLKGDEDGAETTLYFIVRDVDRITMEDKRIVIEELGSDSTKVYRYGWCNVLKKRLSQESLEDFKALNPKCEVFKDYKKFKKFIRDVKINQNASIWQDDAGITRMDDAGASRQTSQKKSSQQYSQSSAGSSKDAPKLSEEEMLELEYQHDEEMFQRKFGNKKKRK